MRKRKIQACAAAVMLLAAATASTLPPAKAALAVDTGKKCSAVFQTPGEIRELEELDIPVDLYRVASISTTGSYQAEKGFESVDFGFVENGGASASVWRERAEEAEKICSKSGREADASATITAGEAEVTGLDTGLYLVMAESVESDQYEYAFSPYLVSLPNNYYYVLGTGDDSWIYEGVEIGLKPQQTERLGDLRIDKELISKNHSMTKKGSFVFQVDIVTPKNETKTKNVMLTFGDETEKSTVISDIPAGSKVTVTEVYSGAGYRLAQGVSAEQEQVIIAGQEVSVSYANESDGTVTGGYGVVNHYEVDDKGAYDWTTMENNASVQY